ncbi:MAG: mercuric reductase [Candidatus Hydrogenedentes bacterium]|nr:mercuric reductase [Candidatus Hydrogenedentota bacterium]
MTEPQPITIEPMDEHNRLLRDRVRPSDWRNPEPEPMYNMLVIGGGTAGLITSIVAAGLGAKVALLERHLMGGDCLNVGCVPSKCIISSSRVAAAFRDATRYGIAAREPEVDFAAVMERLRRLRAGISEVDSARRFKEHGVDVFLGEGIFKNAHAVEVDGRLLRFRKAAIATGAHTAAIPIEGLEEAGYLTNENVFSLTKRPARLAVIGAGPIGCELAQAFRRLGSEVAVLEVMNQALGREDPDAAEIVQRKMEAEGVRFIFNCAIRRVASESGTRTLYIEAGGREESIAVDEILIGAGRKPNVEGMNLEGIGVEFDPRTGVKVNDHLQTTVPHIYAAGDVCMAWKYTHAADVTAQIVVQNSLFSVGPFGKRKLSGAVMPWATYTEPEVAHVGLYEQEAKDKGLEVETFIQRFDEVDRAIVDGEEDGFVKVHTRKGSDKILGATIVAKNAGEMISEVTVAMVNGLGLKAIAATIHPYPTQADALKKVAVQYNKTRLKPWVAKVLRDWMSFRR